MLSTKFGKTLKIESLIGIAVLFAASLLTITSPPSQMHRDSTRSRGEEENRTSAWNGNAKYHDAQDSQNKSP